MAQSMTIGATLNLIVAGRMADGRRGKILETPVWSVAPPGIVSLAVAADGLTGTVTALAEGECVLTVTSDALTPAALAISVLANVATTLIIVVQP